MATKTNRYVKVYGSALSIYQQTSREAWASVQSALPDVDDRIVKEIINNGGATSDAIELNTGMKHQTVSAQIRHMVEGGLLRESGRVAMTRSGRSAIIWEVAI